MAIGRSDRRCWPRQYPSAKWFRGQPALISVLYQESLVEDILPIVSFQAADHAIITAN